MDQPNYFVYFYLKESICSMSMKLRRKFVIGGVINLPKTLVTRPEMTYNGFILLLKNEKHPATIYQSCFLISPGFIMPSFNCVHFLRVIQNMHNN